MRWDNLILIISITLLLLLVLTAPQGMACSLQQEIQSVKEKNMENCLECKEDCSWGSGRFIDRYPRITMNDKDEYVDEGYVCGWCANREKNNG